MSAGKLRRLSLTALFAALCCVATVILHIPSPLGGYFNMGDCIVLLAAAVLPPYYAMAAAGIGSALADLLLGASLYAPATLVIKALMAFVAYYFHAVFSKKNRPFSGMLLGSLSAELCMVLGYFLYEWCLYGLSPSAYNALTLNLPQAAVSIAGGLVLWTVLEKTNLLKKTKRGINHV